MILWTIYLMPLAFYLISMGQQYQLGRPKLYSGHHDLIRLFSGLSGLVIIGGPRLLAHLHFKWTLWGLVEGPMDPWYLDPGFWGFLMLAYWLLVVGVLGCLWKTRANLFLICPADESMVREAVGKTSVREPFLLCEDTPLSCVQLHWTTGLGPKREWAEKEIQTALLPMKSKPGWFWILPVGVGLGLLGFLATINLSSAWWVLRAG